ncbi:hypothetical protein ES703_75458 [subsurface metagenome]
MGTEVSFSGPLFTFEHPDYNTSASSGNSDVVVTFKGVQVSLDCASGLSQIVRYLVYFYWLFSQYPTNAFFFYGCLVNTPEELPDCLSYFFAVRVL